MKFEFAKTDDNIKLFNQFKVAAENTGVKFSGLQITNSAFYFKMDIDNPLILTEKINPELVLNLCAMISLKSCD